jgi:predicted lipid-binding transport protein (Tim44 family)
MAAGAAAAAVLLLSVVLLGLAAVDLLGLLLLLLLVAVHVCASPWCHPLCPQPLAAAATAARKESYANAQQGSTTSRYL